VVVPGEATGLVPVARVAPDVRTTIFLDAPINPDSVRLEDERGRIRLVDAGKSSFTVEALEELGSDRVRVRAEYADGLAPREVSLALISDPAQVDAQLRVARHPRSCEAVEAELAATLARCEAQGAALAALQARCEASGPADLVLAGVLDDTLRIQAINRALPGHGGLRMEKGWTISTSDWLVVLVEVVNTGREPWVPEGATLTRTGQNGGGRVLPVRMKPARLAPGESGRVTVELKAPFPVEFSLQLLDAEGGAALSLPAIGLGARDAHGK
jgi:uncharacterized protein (TIGR02268 family)